MEVVVKCNESTSCFYFIVLICVSSHLPNLIISFAHFHKSKAFILFFIIIIF